jgi:hypothetical protein
MRGIGTRSLGFVAGLLSLVAVAWILTGRAASPRQQGLPTDWSHRHVIFSEPSTDAQAAAVMHDPRYWQQWNRAHFVKALNAGDVGLTNNSVFASAGASHADWSQNLGSGAHAGAGVFPAKYSFQVTSATCAGGVGVKPDYAVFSTGLQGTAGQASIVAFDNLYSGCTGIVPTVYWAFNTGGQVLTSPTISGDGTQVAFVQTNGGIADLVLLKWAPGGTVGVPVTLLGVANAAYSNCTAPCMTTVRLRNSSDVATDDTTSSVFPDYSNDVIWVGGAGGWLHKFTGVFRGTPTRVTTGGFPTQVNPGNPAALSNPVHDSASGNVFVGDYGGFLYRVSSTGVVTASGKVDFGAGLVAGPIVDSTAGKVYVFSSSDGTTNCPGSTPCSAVYLFGTGFAAGNTGTKAVVGASVSFPSSPSPLFEAGFDSKYLASANATGNIYVCGNTGGAPALYQIPINAGAFGTVVTGPTLTSATAGCSPVTDISNPNATGGTTEWIFAGVQASGSGNSCSSGGCVMNFVNTPWLPSHAYTVGQQVLDSHFQIQTVRALGTSRTAAQGPPVWNTTVGGSTTDATTLRWVNQGPQLAFHSNTWLSSHAYALATTLIDTNGNVQVVTTAGISRTAAQGHPVWQTTINSLTGDNTVRWRNTGKPATSSLAATGGTGGIIIDNIVGSGTLAGASQVYFSTQSNQVCGSTGTGGCAVQASQSALQ